MGDHLRLWTVLWTSFWYLICSRNFSSGYSGNTALYRSKILSSGWLISIFSLRAYFNSSRFFFYFSILRCSFLGSSSKGTSSLSRLCLASLACSFYFSRSCFLSYFCSRFSFSFKYFSSLIFDTFSSGLGSSNKLNSSSSPNKLNPLEPTLSAFYLRSPMIFCQDCFEISTFVS